MSCQEIEILIPDYQENQLPPAERLTVEAHLAACSACRSLRQGLLQLDAALAHSIHIPALSTGFETELRQRLQKASPTLSEAQKAERKRQLQAEFEAGQAQLRQGSFGWGSLLTHLALPLLLALAGWIAWQCLPHFRILDALQPWHLDQKLVITLIVLAALFALGLAEAFPRRGKHLA